MKKIFLFAAFAAMTATAQAQTNKGEMRPPMEPRDRADMRQNMDPHQRAEMQARYMQKKLNLTNEQTARIVEVNMQNMPTMPDKDMAGDKKAMHGQRAELMKKREAAYSQILTPDQMTSFRTMKDERMDKMKDMRRERMNGDAPAPQR